MGLLVHGEYSGFEGRIAGNPASGFLTD